MTTTNLNNTTDNTTDTTPENVKVDYLIRFLVKDYLCKYAEMVGKPLTTTQLKKASKSVIKAREVFDKKGIVYSLTDLVVAFDYNGTWMDDPEPDQRMKAVADDLLEKIE